MGLYYQFTLHADPLRDLCEYETLLKKKNMCVICVKYANKH